ncbi:MAG: hypothetical protein JNL98_20515 [Bryobacterales bacterium]|nr:hypothetical protein [Bryobacterales bacterium]
MRRGKCALGLALLAGIAGVVSFRGMPAVNAQDTELPNTGLADAATFLHHYNNWRAASSRLLVIPLQDYGPLSSEAVDASGQVSINLGTGAITSRVTGLPDGTWELWLVDNANTRGNSTLPDSGDMMLNMGRYRLVDGALVLEGRVDTAQLSGFQADRAAVVRAGSNPASGFVLLGSANIYQRMLNGYVRIDGSPTRPVESEIWQLVARGRAIFTDERFQGNTRTCGTCHAESNNFTVDPEFIAKLPASDPLFVHERVPELRNNFENGEMLRKLGLFTENVDGFDDLARKFTLRPSISLQAIGTQIQAPEPVFFADFTAIGQASNPGERLGWGNDALPLRDFAIGAILQHFPRTLSRRAGSDFRIPTDDELDALAAYQLSIGRAEDFDLKKLKLLSVQAIQGQKLYLDTGNIGEPGHKNCNACHFNGGGTTAFGLNPGAPGFAPVLDANPRGFNGTFGTNVSGLSAALMLNLPRDGGFGRVPLPNRAFGNVGVIPDVGPVPVEEFNSMSVVESADTAPFMHNHTVATLEDSIAFYGTPAYQSVESIGDRIAGPVPVKISDKADDPEVLAIATFLRVLNTLENIRSSISAAERARRAGPMSAAAEIASLAREEVIDAMEVMSKGSLTQAADFQIALCRARLVAARSALELARDARDRGAMNSALADALVRLRGAREMLADVQTLPESFRR